MVQVTCAVVGTPKMAYAALANAGVSSPVVVATGAKDGQ